MAESADRHASPPLVALAGWLVPGLGYFLIGQRARGYISGITIIATFVLGLLIGGIRVIDVPGYDIKGNRRMDRIGREEVWKLKSNPMAEILNKPWYMPQTLVGPLNAVATIASLQAAPDHRQSVARIFDIGTLYTAVAGMLNLMIIIDSTYRAANRPSDDEKESA
jgi:hypothetical protein